MLKWFVSIFFGLFFASAHAVDRVQPLPASQAFKLTAEYNQPGLLILHWAMAPTYYLYRDKVAISLAPGSQVQLGAVSLPSGTLKQDSVHGSYQAYTGQLIIPVPVQNEKNGMLNLAIAYQGCAESGFCYPPIHKLLKVDLATLTPPKDVTADLVSVRKPVPVADSLSKQAKVEGIFDGRGLVFIILSFLGLGLLLAFTPCVLPMIPILSGIIVGHGKHLGMRKTFLLSLAYVLGMAITYAVAGMVVAMVGSSLQAQLQRPWVIVMFSGIFVLLALSLFGLYELQMPNAWQRRITAWSNKQKGGSYLSVFVMGSISSLIVSPCVSAPLIGVLSYIADSGNVWLGGFALLALGIGMGLPLLLVGLSAGHILPKAGAWMGVIEKLMGVTMLAFAVWILSRVIPGYVTLFLWSVLAVISAVFLGLFVPAANDFNRLCRGLGLVLFIYGIILMMGAALGNANPLQPWENWKVISPSSTAVANKKTLFVVPPNMQQLDAALAKAAADKKIVFLDFYADWCESCITMDRNVFANEAVQNALADVVVLRADVTKNDDFSQALLKRFHVVAPPTMLFFNRDGTELIADRLVGGVSATEFIAEIKRIQEL